MTQTTKMWLMVWGTILPFIVLAIVVTWIERGPPPIMDGIKHFVGLFG